jgi:hypothetical protein
LGVVQVIMAAPKPSMVWNVVPVFTPTVAEYIIIRCSSGSTADARTRLGRDVR